jgi:hypothetical protein
MTTTATLIELDARGRVSLQKVGPKHTQYLAELQPDGSILLTPAVVMSVAEANFLQNTALVESIEEARRHPERRVQRPPRRRPVAAASGDH